MGRLGAAESMENGKWIMVLGVKVNVHDARAPAMRQFFIYYFPLSIFPFRSP